MLTLMLAHIKKLQSENEHDYLFSMKYNYIVWDIGIIELLIYIHW